MAAHVTTVTRKGQVTIPVQIRRALGLREGDRVAVERHEDGVLMRRSLSVTERTAGITAKYRRATAPTIADLKEAAAQGIAEDARQDRDV